MAKKLTWKRPHDLVTESHCGRYWFVGLHENSRKRNQFRLWHSDTCVKVGHYATKADAKAAAEKHLAGFADEVRNLRFLISDYAEHDPR